jgi:hypothetical protein
MIWNKKEVDRYIGIVLPPEVKTFPEGVRPARDGGGGPELFSRAVGVALLLANDGNNLLLDALREKWPEAVQERLPDAGRRKKSKAAGAPLSEPARLAYA